MGDQAKPPKEKSQPQRERFIQTARELETDETGKVFEDAFQKVVPSKTKRVIFGDESPKK